ncbi:MAG TPA: ATP-binding protein, partial [Anaerolineae bacterium]|nr:ATP-binding protein [Anaerolineae bacterium]
MPFPTNPYTAGDPVGKTDAFVGRSDVLREVLRVLRHPTQNAITLYGQRRIGKTSILQYLELHLPEHGPYHPVLFDLMNKATLPLPAILHDLGRTIAMHLGLPAPPP